MSDGLPTWDEAIAQPPLPPSDGSLPTWDDAVKSNPASWTSTAARVGRSLYQGGVTTLGAVGAEASDIATFRTSPDPAVDAFFKNTAAGRIADSFMGGAADALKEGGVPAIQVGGDTEKSLREAGIFNDYMSGEKDFGKSITEALVRQAATAMDAAYRAGGALFAGGQAFLHQTVLETGAPQIYGAGTAQLARDIAATPESQFGLGGGGHIPSARLPVEVAKARSLGVIGEGEAGYFGTAEPTPENAAARDAAAASLPPSPEAAPMPPEAQPAPVPDIHQLARAAAPEAMQAYDRLTAQSDTLRSQLSDLGLQRTADIDSQIAAIEQAKQGGYGKLQSLKEKRDTILNEGDTPEMAAVRTKLQETDYQMRDLAPDVSAAYRKAQEGLPEPVEPEVAAPPVVQTVPTSSEASQEPTAPIAPVEAPPTDIADDVSQKLIAAGRPKEEADAAAQLVAEHYKAVAEQGWAKGTPEEIYARDGAQIKAGRGADATGISWDDFSKKVDADAVKRRADTSRKEYGEAVGVEAQQRRLRGITTQEWAPGNIVDAGFVKNLLVLGRDDGGAYRLVSKPDVTGVSKVYTKEPHKGLNGVVGEDGKQLTVQFQDAVKGAELDKQPEFAQTPDGEIPSDGRLSQADHEIESKLAEKVGNNFDAAVEEYSKLPETQGGTVLNTDSARELSEDYLRDRTKSSAVQEPASWFIRKLYDEKLKEKATGDKLDLVQFTAGGTGAGKSNAIANIPAVRELADRAQIVYDSNMNWLDGSVEKIDKALAAGKSVNITYVYRDPIEALVNGALPRATRQEKKFGSGRTVPIGEHAATHDGSLETIKAIAEKYKDDHRVTIQVIDNRYGKDGAKQIPLDDLSRIIHDNTYESVRKALDEQRVNGTISDQTYNGFADAHAGDAGADRRVHEEDRSSPGGQPQSERDERYSDAVELAQSARGKIRLATDDAKAAITLMKSANASTFIHETGHHWLDEMMRYAAAPDAPAGLLRDAATVRKWLGVEDGAEIPRKQHEKWARGFERYLMEGTAPSKTLAGVFAKFRQWLVQLYKTVDRLRSPITNDIRDVFDRLLSSKPEKTVITPDHEPGKMLADIHEADAEHTPPEHAAEVADNIRAEMKATAKQDEEASNAITASEAGRGPGDSDQSPAVGGSPGPAPREGIPIPQSEPVGERGGEAAAQGGRPLPEPRPVAGPEPGPGPNTILGRPKSALVDKAGNIRLDNLNTPADVNEVLRQTASENNDFMEARRGVIPAGEQLNLADALGMNPWDLNFRKIGQAFNAEQIIAARKLLVKSAVEVRNLMNGNDVAAYAEAKERHLMIQEHVAGITAEAGRALGAFRKLEGFTDAKALGDFFKEATGKDLFQLEQEMKFGKNLQSAGQVAKFLDASKKATFRDMVLEYYINALISGPITHLRYSVGNAINALATPLVEIPFQAAVGTVRGDADRVYLGEAAAQLHGLFKGSRDGLYAAATAFKTGISPALPGEHLSGNFADTTKVNAIPGLAGKVLNVPTKSVAAIHSFFKSLRYEQNIQALAYRQAMQEGLKDEAFAARVADLGVNPTEAMMKEATSGALRELYMSPTEYNSTMGALNRAINSNLAAKIIVPFMKIGSQITRNAFIERTPLGLLDKDVRANVLGDNGGAARDTQLGKMAVGTSLMATTALMTLEGNATGDGPTDPAQRAIWLLNHRPNSVQIGDITIPYQGLGHLGMLMRFSANMTETARGWDGENGGKLAMSFVEGLSKSVLDENFMRGVKDLLDAVYHPDEYGANYIKQFVTNWLPLSVGMSQVAREVDPDQRQTHSIIDAAWAKVPYASQALMPRRDRFGEPIPNGAPLPQYANDPVVQRMEALQIGVGQLGKKIRGGELTDQQYDDYSRLAGRMAKQRLNAVVRTAGFATIPAGVQIETIKGIIESSRETARNIVMMQNPQIMKDAVSEKLKTLSGAK